MKRILPSSVRLNLVLVVLSGILPMLAVVLVSGLERRNDAIEHAERTTLRLAEYYAYTQENEMRRIREVLAHLAASGPVQAMDIPACNELFQQYLDANPNYVNFALMAPDGEALASALAFKKQNLAERKEIIEVLETGDFAVGEYSIGKVSKVQILPVALPVRNGAGELIGIVLASLRLQDYSRIFEQARLPPGSFVGLTDHDGIRLYHYPQKETNPIGLPVAQGAWEHVSSIERQGLFTSMGSDGVVRVFAVRRLASGPGKIPYLNIFVGIPWSEVVAVADEVTVRYLVWLGFSLLLSSFFAWYVGKHGIVDRVSRLVSFAQRLGAGDMSARTGLAETHGTLGRLESSLNAMAVSLENDIRIRTEMEENLRRSRNEAEEANRAKSKFLANMSHEMRTPLNGIMGMLHLIEDSQDKASGRSEYISLAIQACRRLTQLVNDILDHSKAEAGTMAIRSEPFDLRGVLSTIKQLFAPAAEQKGVAMEVHGAADLPEVVAGDAMRLLQVLNNLMGNAIKFTDQGRVRLEAVLLPHAPEGWVNVLFMVEDTGIGIPEHLLDSLFQAFTQADTGDTRRYEGAGLGLSITRSLVAFMGGGICVDSTPGQGVVFYVSLPFSLARGGVDKPSTWGGSRESLAGLRILIAEDERVNRKALRAQLERLGAEVEAVSNGREALEALSRSVFDLLLLDIQMPVMDGVEAARAVRRGEAGEQARGIPIVALTAYAMPEDILRFRESGMTHHLAKPVEMADLAATLEQALNAPGGKPA